MNYLLNLVIGDNEYLVASYNSIGEFHARWRDCMHDFLKQHIGSDYNSLANQIPWFPYFTLKDATGEIRELSADELRGGAA
jgi:hypothetical protein